MLKQLIIWDFDGVIADISNNFGKRKHILTEGIREIFDNKKIAQCIATGGSLSETLYKIEECNIRDVFTIDDIFTTSMVGVDKIEPNIFQLACYIKGVNPEDAIVVDDSYSALFGAIRAGCTPVAYLGNGLKHNKKYRKHIEDLRVKHIFYNMNELKNFIDNIIQNNLLPL